MTDVGYPDAQEGAMDSAVAQVPRGPAEQNTAANALYAREGDRAATERALALYDLALVELEATYGPDDLRVAVVLNNLACAWWRREGGRLARSRSERALRRALGIARSSPAADRDSVTIEVLDNLGIVLSQRTPPGRPREARAQAHDLHAEALRMLEGAPPSSRDQTARTLTLLGDCWLADREPFRAVDCYERAARLTESAHGTDGAELVPLLANLEAALRAAGRPDEADEVGSRLDRLAAAEPGRSYDGERIYADRLRLSGLHTLEIVEDGGPNDAAANSPRLHGALPGRPADPSARGSAPAASPTTTGPAARRTRRTWVWKLVLGVAATVVMAWLGGRDVPYWRLVTEIRYEDLEVGYCLNTADMWATDDHQAMPKVACTSPHDAEIYAVIDLPAGPFPGDDGIQRLAASLCPPRLVEYYGPGAEAIDFGLGSLNPVENAWRFINIWDSDVGNRHIVCYATLPRGVRGTFSSQLPELAAAASATAGIPTPSAVATAHAAHGAERGDHASWPASSPQ